MFTNRRDPQRIYTDGEHVWHYTSTLEKDSFRIAVIRHVDPGQTPYCVCVMDTRSNPNAEQDADTICATLNAQAGTYTGTRT